MVQAFVDRPNSTFRILVRKTICAGYISESEVRIPGADAPDSGNDLCNYAQTAGEALAEAQGALADAKPHISDGAWLRQAAQLMETRANAFGARRQPAGTDNLQLWTAGSIVAASRMLDEWAAGRPGEADAETYLRLLESAAGEVNRIRREQGCR